MSHQRLEAFHKFAYRLILATTLVIDYIQPEWVKVILKTAPYTLLAFDFYLYSPFILFRVLLKSRTLKMLVVAAVFSMNMGSYINHEDHHQTIVILREDTQR